MKLQIAQSLILLMSLTACHSFMDKIPDPAPVSAEQLNSFEAINTQIIEPKCLSCHSAPAPKGDVDLSSYAAIMATSGVVVQGNAAASSLYKEVASGDMPDNGQPLSANEVAAIKEWIDGGAPNGSFSVKDPQTPPNPGPSVTPTPSSTPSAPPSHQASLYQQVQKEIFDKSCVRCHGGTKPSAHIDLSSYEKLMSNKKSGLIQPGDAFKSLVYTEIEKGSMPPRGARVDNQLLAILKDWIDAGATKN